MRIKSVSLFLVAMLFFSAESLAEKSFTKDTVLMGSSFNFTAISSDFKSAEHAVNMAIKEVVRIERLISSWDKNSETTVINNAAGLSPTKVSDELFDLIFRAKKISKMSNGYFDISFASIHQVWNFEDSIITVPTEALIVKSIDKINYENIILDSDQRTVFLKEKGMKIGFGSIGKGYAANKAKAVMLKFGAKSGVVNAGGDLVAWGKNKNDKLWSVGIVNPLKKEQVALWLEVENTAIVTSGNYEKYIEIEGKKYCHIINPKTGWPARGILSVTIICQDAELADGLATTVFILGVKDGLNLVNHLVGVEAVLISENGAFHYSKGLDQNKTIKAKNEK